MEVALTQELEKLIAEQVESGNYPSPGEVIRDALRFFKEQLELRERSHESLRQDVRLGLEALERGEYDEYDADDIHRLASEIKIRGRTTGCPVRSSFQNPGNGAGPEARRRLTSSKLIGLAKR